jgi:PAS domain S-box-containing protein
VERRLGADELIVSKTDAKGVITYANDVFCRIAAMPEEDVVGQPHNLIRHPAMPRAVFKLLWDTIAGGQEIFAYVNNLAADGANYWVFAHVTPSYDAAGRISGYHSNRRAPHRDAIAAVTPVYAALVAEEARHPRAADGLAASTAMLDATLVRAGLAYDEWVWTVTP